MTATTNTSTASLSTVANGSAEPEREKNIERTTIDPNSATEHAATTNVPVRVSSTPASFSTGTTMPREVDDRMIVISNGLSTTSNAASGRESASPIAIDSDEPQQRRASTGARGGG